MGNKKVNKSAGRVITGGLLLTLAIMLGVGSAVETNYLLTSWWIPLSVSVFIAAVLALPMRRFWQWLTESDKTALNLLVHMVVMTPIIYFAILTVNYVFRFNTSTTVNAKVERVYSETRYHTRRVSRRVYTRGTPYKAYGIEITFHNGKKRHFDVKKNVYDRLVKGDTITVDIYKGRLGMQVFNSSELKLGDEKTKARKKHINDENRRGRMHEKYREHQQKIYGNRQK